MLTIALLGLAFTGSHFMLSLAEVRSSLVRRFGEKGFLGIYSLIAGVLLALLIVAYGEVNRSVYWWYPDPLSYQITMVLMWIATLFVVGSFMAPNPSNLGMGDKAGQGPQGMLRITRHPLLVGIFVWASAHILSNGDVASVVFFLTFAALAGVGALVLDQKKSGQLGEDWNGFVAQTSILPFVAILGGRTRLAGRELIAPLALGTGIYFALFWAHEWVSGVDIVVPF